MKNTDIEKIGIILGQFGGPISTKQKSDSFGSISLDLIRHHKNTYKDIDNYTRSEYFSLYHILKYVIEDLSDNSFELITVLDLHSDGYDLLDKVKKFI